MGTGHHRPAASNRPRVMRRHLSGLLAVVCTLAIGACRSGPGAAGPHRQHLTTATISDPKTFNPVLAVDASSANATEDLFEGLLRLNPQTLEQEPALAERWESNADGTV